MSARSLSWLGVLAVVVIALVAGREPSSPSSTPAARLDRIAAGLRCPVCQGLSVKDSDAPTANDLREDIRRRIEQGEDDDTIRQAYVERYGAWILLRPPSEGFGALVWALPGAGAVLAVAGLALAFWRWRRAQIEPASAGDRRLVEDALGHSLGG